MAAHESGAFSAAEFAKPPREYSLLPWWFWNGDMDPDEIRRQVDAFADAGIGGFFVQARQGLSIPYLSDEWFARFDVALNAAERRGMRVWLYDEYPYPSGIAGGLVTAQMPETKKRRLERFDYDVSGGRSLATDLPLGRLVSAMAYPVRGARVVWEEGRDIRSAVGILQRSRVFRQGRSLTDYSQKRYFSGGGQLCMRWKAPTGDDWRVFVGIETDFHGFKYYDCFVDVLQPGATARFLELTHEAYAARYAERLGESIPGIYADEITAPEWSPVIQEHLWRHHGVDLSRDLAALTEDAHPSAARIRYLYHRVATDLFVERFEDPIHRWCQEHHIIYTGEKPILRPEHLAHVGLPGNDAGHVRVGGKVERLSANLRKNPRVAQSAAHHFGSRRALVECYHSMGWGARLQDYKWVADWLAAMGTNLYCNHAVLYSIGGLRKHDAAPSQFYQNPYWAHFGALSDHIKRLSYAQSRGDEVAPTLVLHPTESLWVGGEATTTVERDYGELLDGLMGRHRMFHIVDGRTLQTATTGEGTLSIGRGTYTTLLVPRLCAADRDTARGIERARAAGIRIMAVEPMTPQDVDGTDVLIVLAQADASRFSSVGDLLASLDSGPRTISVRSDGACEDADVWLAHRRAPDDEGEYCDLVWITNLTANERRLDVCLETKATCWDRLSVETGTSSTLPSHKTGKHLCTKITLAPYEGALLRSTQSKSTAAPVERHRVHIDCTGQWAYSLDGPNALRLNRWRLGFGDDVRPGIDYDDGALPVVAAKPLVSQLASSDSRCAPANCDGAVWYRRTVWCDQVPPTASLLIESQALIGEWTCYVNEHEIRRRQFESERLYDVDNLSCPVAHLLRVGPNVIAFRFTAPPMDGGLLQPIHLIGEFAVRGRGERHLTTLPQSIAFGRPAADGLPHYSGTITYSRRIPADRVAEATELALGTASPLYDVVEARLDGHSLGARAWAPYVWPVESWQARASGVTIEVAVTNTLLPILEGQQWDDATHSARDV